MSVALDVRKAPYVPYGGSRELWKCRDREILHDGPVRTGKTRGALEKVLAAGLIYPGSRQLIMRRFYKDLAETTLQVFEDHVLPREWVPKGDRSNRHKYELPNGSAIMVMGLDRPTAAMGMEIDRALFDEAIEIPRETAQYISTRLTNGAVSEEGEPMYPQLVYLTNPGAPTHWLWQRYLKEGLRRIPSTFKDNPRWWNLEAECWTPAGQELIAGLEKLTGHLKRRLLKGEWAGVEGMIYDLFDETLHVLRADGKPNPSGLVLPRDFANLWRVRAVDFGFKEPFVCGWAAVDGDGTIYLEREYIKCQATINAHARRIKRLTPTRQHVQFTVADHDAGDRAVLREAGIDTVRAIKPKGTESWTSHFEPVWERLKRGENGRPRLFVLDNTVQMGSGSEGPDPLMRGKPLGFREELTQYAWEQPKDGEAARERPVQVHDHACDMLRYMVHAVDRWFDGTLKRDAEPYERGSVGHFLGLDEDEDV